MLLISSTWLIYLAPLISAKAAPCSENAADYYNEFEPPPLVTRGTVLALGVFMFVLAMIWPPLLLVLAYVASLVIPYSYRVNDEAAARRMMVHKFMQEDQISKDRSVLHENVDLQSGYWMNQRGLLLHTNTMTPKHKPAKAVVCFCHGEEFLWQTEQVKQG